MLPLIGLLLWILALTALVRVVVTTPAVRAAGRRDVLLWGLLALLGAALLMRPNEEIFGGQDPGSYANSAVSFARHGTLFHVDPLLAQVPEDARAGFFYGHRGFGRTKDACLWVRDAAAARLGPWFQPAYPVMMSPVARVAPFAVLYGVPLLGWMTAVVLACLASRLIARPRAAAVTYVAYLLMPVIVWNARCPRAEMAASFFLLAGWALLLHAWQAPRWKRWPDVVLGVMCLGTAPFFHVTAWHAVLASFAILAVAAMAGRDDFLMFLPAAFLSAAGFLAQCRFVTDCYHVWSLVGPRLVVIWPIAVPALLALVTGLAVLSIRAGRRPARPAPGERLRNTVAVVLAVVPPLLMLAVYLTRNGLGQLPFLGAWTASYLTLTDVRGLVRLTSLPAALAAVGGWIWLAVRRDRGVQQWPCLAFMAAMLPGVLMTGWMDDYMMETRRLMIVPAPAMALCLGALVAGAGALRSRWAAPVAAAAGVLLLATMAWHKMPLYTQTEYRGFHRFLAPFARDIEASGGILLAEYAQVAAPFEHFFGIPLLSIDSDRQTDYRQQEAAWRRIMEARPNRPSFFISPYADPLSDTFDFMPVRSAVFKGVRMPAARRTIPDQVRPFELPLHLYRMSLKQAPGVSGPASFDRVFGGGNMGLRRFSVSVTKAQQARGCRLAAEGDTRVSWQSQIGEGVAKDLYVFVLNPTNRVTAPRVTVEGAERDVPWTPLVSGWWTVTLRNRPAGIRALTLRAGEDGLVLTHLIERSGNICLPAILETPVPTDAVPLPPFTARWARDGAELLLPAPAGRASDLFVLMRLISDQPGEALSLSMDERPATPAGLRPGVWEWRVFPVPPAVRSNNVARITFRSNPPWRSGLRGYPDDLAVLVGAALSRSGGDGAP